MWKIYLESKGHTCFHFNAWKNDFVDDPLVAFLGEISKHIEKEKIELNSDKPVQKYLGEVKRIGAGVLRKALPLAGEAWRIAFGYCVKALALSLRTQEQCFTEMNIVLRMNSGQREVYPVALSFFSALRAYRPGIFQELRNHQLSIDTVNGWFVNVHDSWYNVWFEAALIHGFCDNREERQTRLQKLKEKYSKPEDNQFYDAKRPGRLAESLSEDWFSREMLYVLSQFEMTSQFH
jgi:hypothetical protein